ncbi:MAG: 16S rRNA (uracil(1498)-N(3))-methyltransferase [Verrucomicrobia bacterium]|nr:MAG: 16S rRNA (uracil(1498)-N(3))-methyltransferase [Verrucomicrobiota bacterium]
MKFDREHLRCYVAPAAWRGTMLTPDETEAHHLVNVLRAREGEHTEVFDGAGRTGMAQIDHISKRDVELRLLEQQTHPRPVPELILVQALPREATMDFVVQKAVELGATAILPVLSARCVVRLKPDQFAGKSARWQRIVLNAGRQSHATWLPRIANVQTLENFFQTLEKFDFWCVGSLVANAQPLHTVLSAVRARAPQRVAVLIGPEGDLTPEEYRAAEAAGAVPVAFGTNVLRVDTAALFALSVLHYELVNSG